MRQFKFSLLSSVVDSMGFFGNVFVVILFKFNASSTLRRTKEHRQLSGESWIVPQMLKLGMNRVKFFIQFI